MKCLLASNKLLLLRWFKFLLLLTNFLQNRITLLLVLKLLQSTKLITPRIQFFFFFYFIMMYLFLLSSSTLKCLLASNKFLLLRWFKFLLLLTNFLQNRITLLLVLKLLQFTKLITPRIHFFFFLLHHDVFVSSVLLFFLKKNFITPLDFFFFFVIRKSRNIKL